MNEILLANLFFIITGSAVLVVATFLCLLCYHLIRIVQKGHTILEQLETRAELLVDDVKALRDRIAQSTIVGRILVAIVGAVTREKPKRASHRHKKEITNE